MSKLPNYPIVVRRHKTSNNIELFMVDHGKMTCFSWSEGHGSCDIGYYRNKTNPVSLEEAMKYFSAYTKDWEGESSPVLRQRLKSGSTLGSTKHNAYVLCNHADC